jgi:hypothetical protein
MIASAYGGFGLEEIKTMTVRQRAFWYKMASWRNSNS